MRLPPKKTMYIIGAVLLAVWYFNNQSSQTAATTVPAASVPTA